MPKRYTLLAAALLLVPGSVAAQGPSLGSGTRFGVSFGGISTVGVMIERFDDNRSVELGIGTWAFRDLSLNLVAKQYIGGRALQPFVGAGLWMVIAAPEDERTGFALSLSAPVGLDWSMADDHAMGGLLNLSRVLTVRRSDPEDDRPSEGRIVPLPGLYYRFTR